MGGFKAALVRDPLRRVASAFHEVALRRASKEELNQPNPASLSNQSYLASMLVEMLADSNDQHFALQYQFLIDSRGEKIDLDYIGMADNLEEELKFIFRYPGLTVDSQASGPRHVKAPSKYAGFQIYRIDVDSLPDWAVQRVCSRYVVDYCCLGFEFPTACRNLSCSSIFAQPGPGNSKRPPR